MCTNQVFKYLGILILFSLGYAYSVAQTPEIDSLYIIPESSQQNDQLFVVAKVELGYSPCFLDSFIVEVNNFYIEVFTQYVTGIGAGTCGRTDTIFLGSLVPGNYKLIYFAKYKEISDTSEDSTSFFVDFPQILNTNYLPGINIYPNPADEQVFIEMAGKGVDEQEFQVELYNYTGRRLLQINGFNKTTLDTKGLPRGIYFLHISSHKTFQKSVHKIIIN